MLTPATIHGFAAAFSGLARAHGRYEIPNGAKADGEGKIKGKAWTTQEPVTTELWRNHLEGRLGLGIIPIDDEGTTSFGAIDVDVYPLDLAALLNNITSYKLPLILCRTKSGGAHLYLFCRPKAPAALVRAKLAEWAVLLGYPGVEVFPKQSKLASEADTGNWINIPYNGGDRTLRYALKPDASAATPEEFLSLVDTTAITPAELESFQTPTHGDSYDDLLKEAPPCLETRARIGFGDWQNNGMFNIAVYLKKRYKEDWLKHFSAYNTLMKPPLTSRELASIAKSLSKKHYSFQCRQEPICSVCNRGVCLTRKYGVAGSADDPQVTFGDLDLLDTDPPLWMWDVNGLRLEISTEDIMDQRRFQKVCFEKLGVWPAFVKDSTWREIVGERLAKANRTPVPEDATKEGQLWVLLVRFCTSRVIGRNLDELLLGKPYTDGDGRTYFCSTDFMDYMHRHKATVSSERELYRVLARRGVKNHTAVIKGKELSYWSIPAPSHQTEPHDIPRATMEKM